jgi:hypothetical protein
VKPTLALHPARPTPPSQRHSCDSRETTHQHPHPQSPHRSASIADSRTQRTCCETHLVPLFKPLPARPNNTRQAAQHRAVCTTSARDHPRPLATSHRTRNAPCPSPPGSAA